MECYSTAGLPASIKSAGNYLYTWMERGTVRVKRLAQEHNGNKYSVKIGRLAQWVMNLCLYTTRSSGTTYKHRKDSWNNQVHISRISCQQSSLDKYMVCSVPLGNTVCQLLQICCSNKLKGKQQMCQERRNWYFIFGRVIWHFHITS